MRILRDITKLDNDALSDMIGSKSLIGYLAGLLFGLAIAAVHMGYEAPFYWAIYPGAVFFGLMFWFFDYEDKRVTLPELKKRIDNNK